MIFGSLSLTSVTDIVTGIEIDSGWLPLSVTDALKKYRLCSSLSKAWLDRIVPSGKITNGSLVEVCSCEIENVNMPLIPMSRSIAHR